MEKVWYLTSIDLDTGECLTQDYYDKLKDALEVKKAWDAIDADNLRVCGENVKTYLGWRYE